VGPVVVVMASSTGKDAAAIGFQFDLANAIGSAAADFAPVASRSEGVDAARAAASCSGVAVLAAKDA